MASGPTGSPAPRPADLRSPAALAMELAVGGPDGLAAVSAVRRAHPEVDPALISALATQARLRERARPRLGTWAEELVLSDTGLQQASRAEVARYRGAELARRLGRVGVTVADLGCGLGVDSLGLAAAGFNVRAVESDAWTAEAAQINATIIPGRISVLCVDAMQVDLEGCAAAFCDPARRDESGPSNRAGTRALPYADPAQWSPPWPWVRALSDRLPVVAKAAPGLPGSHVPDEAEREWIACAGELVETCVWFAPLAAATRRATAIDPGGRASVSDRDAESHASAEPASVLVEASPAVVRARLLPALAARLGIAAVRGSSHWLTAAAPLSDPLARCWHVERELPADPVELRAALRGRGSVTWKTRDIDTSAEDIARRVGHRLARTGTAITVAWVRVDGRPHAYEIVPATS